MKTKIFYGNQHITSFNCDGKRYTRFGLIKMKVAQFIKRTIIVSLIVVIASYIATGSYFYAKSSISPVTVWAKSIVEVPIKEISPVLARIAKCESGGVHTKDGQVIFNANTNKTVDIGKYQINSMWNKKASELGLDLTKESDNEKMAMWIYENRGTGDWYSSQSCWNK